MTGDGFAFAERKAYFKFLKETWCADGIIMIFGYGKRNNDLLKQVLANQEKEMASIDDLNTALANLATAVQSETADINAALAVITTPGATDAQVQAATAAVNTAISNINAGIASIKAVVPSAP